VSSKAENLRSFTAQFETAYRISARVLYKRYNAYKLRRFLT